MKWIIDHYIIYTDIIHMKPVQIMLDEKLLEALDEDDEVRRLGRSAVIRHLAEEYLARRQNQAITAQYREAYDQAQGREFEGWEEEGVWPGAEWH